MNFHLLTQYLDSLYEEYGIPALDVIVTKEHETVYRHMTGFADMEKTRPVSERDFYLMFSCTKLVTMTAMMQLIEAGKVSLYDPVSRFLPEWEYMTVINADWMTKGGDQFCPKLNEPSHFAKNRVRIIDCMSMTAGLTYDLNSEAIRELISRKPNASTREVVAAIARMPLLFEPGTRYRYSLGHDVIAAVIEAISGERFSDYLDRHIFAPLGITDLTCHMTDEQKSRLSAIYRYESNTKAMACLDGSEPVFSITPNYESGGAALAGTADAYAAVTEALANGGVGRNGTRILKEDSVMLFTRSVLTGEALKDFRKGRFYEYSYGLGVRVKTDSILGQSPVGEFGWDGAAGGYAVVDPFNRVSIFYVEHILNFFEGYSVIHPRVRDLVYKGLSRD
ncbi:MAG: beta-lactamase family protein [Clostridiales bacterium]|nr:beta-lactamase family protein [Clostridiales bacterium]